MAAPPEVETVEKLMVTVELVAGDTSALGVAPCGMESATAIGRFVLPLNRKKAIATPTASAAIAAAAVPMSTAPRVARPVVRDFILLRPGRS